MVAGSLTGSFATLRPCDRVARSQVALEPAGGFRARAVLRISLTGKIRGLKWSKLEIKHSHEEFGKTQVTLGFVGTKTKNKIQPETLSAHQQVIKTMGWLDFSKKCWEKET